MLVQIIHHHIILTPGHFSTQVNILSDTGLEVLFSVGAELWHQLWKMLQTFAAIASIFSVIYTTP